MNYKFPTIRHIDDVRPAFAGHDEIAVIDKGGWTAINYLVAKPDTFWPQDEAAIMRRECRGLVFDSTTGAILRRPFHKFFNYGEHPEIGPDAVRLDAAACLLDKLDGSMIAPFVRSGFAHWATRMSMEEVAARAAAFVVKHPRYDQLAMDICPDGLTPIFEWCSRSDRIVVDHPEDRLVLLAIREMESGEYLPRENVVATAEHYRVECVQACPLSVEAVRCAVGLEGLVVNFPDGHRLKIKSDWYLALHKAKESIAHEKNVWKIVLDGRADDLKPILLDSDLARLEAFEKALWEGVDDATGEIACLVSAHSKPGSTRKDFAMAIQKAAAPWQKALCFLVYDGASPRGSVVDRLKGCLASETRLQEAKQLVPVDW